MGTLFVGSGTWATLDTGISGPRDAAALGDAGDFGALPLSSGVAFNVTRTVSFFKGTAEVFFIGFGGLGG